MPNTNAPRPPANPPTSGGPGPVHVDLTVKGVSTEPAVPGVLGENDAHGGNAVEGISSQGYGVHGMHDGGTLGRALPDRGAGVWGESSNGYGVIGFSLVTDAVQGISKSQSAAGVAGRNDSAGGAGVLGSSAQGVGVKAICESGANAGLFATSKQGPGVHGINEGRATVPERGAGVWGESVNGFGVFGSSVNSNGVYGHNQSGTAVAGVSEADTGVYGRGALFGGRFDGNVSVNGKLMVSDDILINNQDCAEDFDVVDSAGVEPGTVMVIDGEGGLRPSERAYDKRVAGVVSGGGSFKPGIILGKQASQDGRMPIALLGKVYCKVDARDAPIEVGDLLTTSATPGHAMKADDHVKAFGAVIGKALRPLQRGQGLIPILIALQ